MEEAATPDAVVEVEHIQDLVEKELIAAGLLCGRRRYILYSRRACKLRNSARKSSWNRQASMRPFMVNCDGRMEHLDFQRLRSQVNGRVKV